jgi:formylglycine-generating enzyme required for sulfatase activity
MDLTGLETELLDSAEKTRLEATLAVPGFELRGELGRGGMGIVFRAWQQSLKRWVALKVLPPALARDSYLLERFRNEAAVAAGLVDAHILPVFDIQEIQGVPIIIMPLIEGSDLERILRDRRAVRQGRAPTELPHAWASLDDRAYLNQMLPLLDHLVGAVAALHRGGVLHRDIKPSNVLVDARGGVWLSDFGLARLEEQGIGTQPGMRMGTAAYASPEQARGDEEIDFRSDLFSLGATLYEALTLELPYGKNGAEQTPISPKAPSQLQGLLSRDFDVVLLKPLERERGQRYRSTAELQEDWKRIRAGQAPRERLAGSLRRLARAVRGHARAVTAALLLVLALGLIGALFWPSDSTVYRSVHLVTEPPGARVVLVPLDDDTGSPEPARAIRPTGRTPLVARRVPVGEYLVVVEVAGHGFHEVYRIVSPPQQTITGIGQHRHRMWQEQADGSVELPEIKILPADEVKKGMAFFRGGTFTMGTKEIDFTPPHERDVESFYLDVTEVSVGAWKTIMKGLPTQVEGWKPTDDEALRWVTFDQAVAYAEDIGKRLPDEAEYEFAATNGGQTRFPWKKDLRINDWPLGKVGEPSFDQTPTNPPVFGLFSNVAEWTTSWNTPYPGFDPPALPGFYSPQMQAKFRGTFVVRGGPFEVLEGNFKPNDPADPALNPRWRHSISRDKACKGLGFRCALSARPRYLEP